MTENVVQMSTEGFGSSSLDVGACVDLVASSAWRALFVFFGCRGLGGRDLANFSRRVAGRKNVPDSTSSLRIRLVRSRGWRRRAARNFGRGSEKKETMFARMCGGRILRTPVADIMKPRYFSLLTKRAT